MKEVTCTLCPRGCRLYVDEKNNFTVTGNTCPRGAEYGRAECENPVRTLTSTVKVLSGEHPRCPVKTDCPISRALVMEAACTLRSVTLCPPVRAGQVVVKNICGSGANVIATRNI